MWQSGIEFLLLRIGRTSLICLADVVEVLVIFGGFLGEVVFSREMSLMVEARLVESSKTANL